MFTVKKVALLEEKLPPAKLLYLSDAPIRPGTAAEIADCLGTLLAVFPSALPNYMKEVGIVWARYHNAAAAENPAAETLSALAAAPANFGPIRMAYADKLHSGLPAATVPPPSVEHCRSLVSLLQRVAATTSFGRTGDQMVHKTILAQVPPDKAAALSTMEMPFAIAGVHWGDEANRVVRQYFERNVDTTFATTAWETTRTTEAFIFAASILFETGGELYSAIGTASTACFEIDNPAPVLYAWKTGKFGILYRHIRLGPREDLHFPIIATLLHFLELMAYSGTEGASAASSILCAVKTPREVRFLPVSRPVLAVLAVRRCPPRAAWRLTVAVRSPSATASIAWSTAARSDRR